MNGVVRGPRLDAAQRCYSMAQRRQPGSVDADAAEQAVLYVLSERRDAGDTEELVRNAVHDGRRSVMRARYGRVRVDQELAHLSAAGVDTAGARATSSRESAQDVVLARELLSELKRAAVRLGQPAPRVLAGMLIGETEQETARALGSSRSTVTRARRALRQCAMSAGYLPVAA